MRAAREFALDLLRAITQHRLKDLAAQLAFWSLLALFPFCMFLLTIVAYVPLAGMETELMGLLHVVMPGDAWKLFDKTVHEILHRQRGGILVVSLLAALWSASSGTGNLLKAINIAYDEDETRGFLKVRGIALALTLGAIVFVLLTLALVAVVPVVLNALPLGPAGTVLAQVLRWVLLVALVVAALAITYRVAPDRDQPRFSWVTTGSLVATVLWIVGSVAFSLYVNNFGSYNKTYGAIAGVVVLMLWLYLTSYIVLLGAEINAESERQTRADTTRGAAAPMGERGAAAADELARP
jgi:membrane protein